jgi:cytochrome c oxidase assembly factor CtaG
MIALPLLSGGHTLSPQGFWYSWADEPLMTIVVFALTAMYAIGWSRLHAVAPKSVPVWRLGCYLGGVLAFAAALLSPIAAYSEELFAMHMVQHLLLLIAAPPLILLGAPFLPMLWSLPRSWRRPIGRLGRPGQPLYTIGQAITHPLVAVSAYVGSVAIWHIPAFYDAAQGRTFTHDLEHVMFYGTALLYWWPIIHPTGGRRRLSLGMALPYLVPPFLEGMAIGITLTFSSRPLYSTYASLDTDPIWGLDTLNDQQLGGLIMWVPGGLFFLIPLLGILMRLLIQQEREQERRERATSRA